MKLVGSKSCIDSWLVVGPATLPGVATCSKKQSNTANEQGSEQYQRLAKGPASDATVQTMRLAADALVGVWSIRGADLFDDEQLEAVLRDGYKGSGGGVACLSSSCLLSCAANCLRARLFQPLT